MEFAEDVVSLGIRKEEERYQRFFEETFIRFPNAFFNFRASFRCLPRDDAPRLQVKRGGGVGLFFDDFSNFLFRNLYFRVEVVDRTAVLKNFSK